MPEKTTHVQLSASVLLHISAGGDAWDPTDEDLRTLEGEFKAAIAAADPNSEAPIVVATRQDVRVSAVPLVADLDAHSHEFGDPSLLTIGNSILRRGDRHARCVLHWRKLHEELHDADREVYATFSEMLRASLVTLAAFADDGDAALLEVVTASEAWYQSYLAWSAPNSVVQTTAYLNDTKFILDVIDALNLRDFTDALDDADGDTESDVTTEVAWRPFEASDMPRDSIAPPGALALHADHEHHERDLHISVPATQVAGARRRNQDTVLSASVLRTIASDLIRDFESVAQPGMAASIEIKTSWYATAPGGVNCTASASACTDIAADVKNVHAPVDTMHVPV